MKVALASPPFPKSINDGIFQIEKLIKDAADKEAEIICFPESYLPGYPLEEYEVEKVSPEKLQLALNRFVILQPLFLSPLFYQWIGMKKINFTMWLL